MTTNSRGLSTDVFAAECIEPSLANDLGRRNDPDCPDGLRERLATHLVYCASCRLDVAIEQRLVAGLRSGRLVVEAHRGGRAPWWHLALGGIGATSLAAGLVLMLSLPPRASAPEVLLRSGQRAAIVQPVPGEVIRGGRPEIRWTSLPDATRYDVQVSMVGGEKSWTETVREPRLALTGDQSLPVGARYRVRVVPMPTYLVPDGMITSSFRTGSFSAWLDYRLRHGATVGRVFGLAGLILLLVAGYLAVKRRRWLAAA